LISWQIQLSWQVDRLSYEKSISQQRTPNP
jgi:hypothetical protein